MSALLAALALISSLTGGSPAPSPATQAVPVVAPGPASELVVSRPLPADGLSRFVDVYLSDGTTRTTPVSAQETTTEVPADDWVMVGYRQDNGDGTFSSGTCRERPVKTESGQVRVECG